MTRSQAVCALENIERILREVSRLNSSTSSQLETLAARASHAAAEVDDVVRLLKKLDREAER